MVLKLIRIRGISPLSVGAQEINYLNEIVKVFFFQRDSGVVPGLCWDTVRIGGCVLGFLWSLGFLPASSGSLQVTGSFREIFSVWFLCTMSFRRFLNQRILVKVLPNAVSHQDPAGHGTLSHVQRMSWAGKCSPRNSGHSAETGIVFPRGLIYCE